MILFSLFSSFYWHSSPFLIILRFLGGYTMLARVSTLLSIAVGALAHGDHGQTPLAGATEALWHNTLPGDGGTQV